MQFGVCYGEQSQAVLNSLQFPQLENTIIHPKEAPATRTNCLLRFWSKLSWAKPQQGFNEGLESPAKPVGGA